MPKQIRSWGQQQGTNCKSKQCNEHAWPAACAKSPLSHTPNAFEVSSRPPTRYSKSCYMRYMMADWHCVHSSPPLISNSGNFRGFGGLWANSQGAPKGRQQKGETGPGTHIFADFCRFLARSVNQGILESQICAENRRKPQVSPICYLPLARS